MLRPICFALGTRKARTWKRMISFETSSCNTGIAQPCNGYCEHTLQNLALSACLLSHRGSCCLFLCISRGVVCWLCVSRWFATVAGGMDGRRDAWSICKRINLVWFLLKSRWGKLNFKNPVYFACASGHENLQKRRVLHVSTTRSVNNNGSRWHVLYVRMLDEARCE